MQSGGGNAYSVNYINDSQATIANWTTVVDGLQKLYEESETVKWEYSYKVEEVAVKAGNTNVDDSTYTVSLSTDGALTDHETVTITNNKTTSGSIKLKKIVQLSGSAVQNGDNTLDGQFTFTIAGKAETETEGIKKTVVITLNAGTHTATIADQDGGSTVLTAGSDGYFTITDLHKAYTLSRKPTRPERATYWQQRLL